MPSWLKLKMCAPKKKACEICSTVTSAPSGAATSTAASALRYFSMSASIFACTASFQIAQYLSDIADLSTLNAAEAESAANDTAQKANVPFIFTPSLL